MVLRKTRQLLLMMVAVLITASTAASAGSAGEPLKKIVVHGPGARVEKLRTRLGAAVLNVAADVHLLAVSSRITADDLKEVERLFGVVVEEERSIRLPNRRRVRSANTPPAKAKLSRYYTSTAPDDYVNQPVSNKLQLKQALQYATGRRTVVAIIDTGIDPHHPLLVNSLLPGKNYVIPSADASEWNDNTVMLTQHQAEAFMLDQRQADVFMLDQRQAEVFMLDQHQAEAFMLDQRQAEVFMLDGLPPAFGHGTMVAGLVHLVAPEALIMPLKAFNAYGEASMFDVVQAIRDATEYGADVINLSFSGNVESRLLERVIDWARLRGVNVVASAGNNNTSIPTYPASLTSAVGVGATNLDDSKAPFSNYGEYVDVSGPGVGLITTYPGGYAVVAGTSFSVPLVAGELLMLRELGLSGEAARMRLERTGVNIDHANRSYRKQLGVGMNILGAVRNR